MKRRELEQLLDRLVVNVPRAIRQAGLKPNACILAGRMGAEALRSQGVRVRALATDVAVMNAPYAERIQSGVPWESEEEALASGAWIVSIDADSARVGDGWPRHLVLIVEERYVLDLTAGQLARPAKGIRVEPLWMESREMARGERAAWGTEDGNVLLYHPDPSDRSFVKLPAWSAYRVRVAGGLVISERTGPDPDAPVAPEIRAPIGR